MTRCSLTLTFDPKPHVPDGKWPVGHWDWWLRQTLVPHPNSKRNCWLWSGAVRHLATYSFGVLSHDESKIHLPSGQSNLSSPKDPKAFDTKRQLKPGKSGVASSKNAKKKVSKNTRNVRDFTQKSVGTVNIWWYINYKKKLLAFPMYFYHFDNAGVQTYLRHQNLILTLLLWKSLAFEFQGGLDVRSTWTPPWPLLLQLTEEGSYWREGKEALIHSKAFYYSYLSSLLAQKKGPCTTHASRWRTYINTNQSNKRISSCDDA